MLKFENDVFEFQYFRVFNLFEIDYNYYYN